MTGSNREVWRIASAWRELRRGAAGAELRSHLVGDDGPELQQGQLDALEILASDPDGWRMREFADALRVDPSTATRAVLRLERLGLAERSTDEQDRRVVTVRATKLGTDTMRTIIEKRAVGMRRLLEPFNDAELEQFAEYLERFVDSIDQLSAELAAERRDHR